MTQFLANDLFLLMVSLSQLTQRDRIVRMFLEAVNNRLAGTTVAYLPEGEPAESGALSFPLATLYNRFGQVALSGDLGSLSPESVALLRNSVATLAIMLENRLRAELLQEEKLELDREMGRTARELLEANQKLEEEMRMRARAQESLRRNEERLRLAMEATQDGLWDWDVTSGAVFWSPRAFTMLGYRPDEFRMSFEKWLELLHPEDRESAWAEVSAAMEKDHGGFLAEFRYKSKDQGWLWVMARGRVVERDAQGRGLRMVGTHVDLSERKRMEMALADSQQRLEQAQAAAKLGHWRWDRESESLEWSDATRAIFGAQPGSQATYQGLLERIHPEDRARHEAITRKLLQGQEAGPYHYRITMADGGARWIYAVGRPELDAAGNTVALSGFVMDITELELAKQAQSASERKYRLLVENAQDAVYILQKGTVRYANPSACKITGYSLDELMSRPFAEFLDPLETETENQWQSQAGKQTVRFSAKDGRQVWLQVSRVVMDWEDEPATLNIARDISEQRMMERQLSQSQKMEALGTLAGGIAHDFNNILAAIIGYTELSLADAPGDSLLRDNLASVLRAAQRAKGLVSQILGFTRSGEPERKPLSLARALADSLELLRATLPSTIEIRQSTGHDLGMVLADPTQMHQMVMNICTNAAHAMENGGGVLGIGLARRKLDQAQAAMLGVKPGGYQGLSIADTGIGMDQATLERVFEPFFTTKPRGRGTGMGMAVVHGIVQAHQGAIDVKSSPGKGSTVTVYLPETNLATREEAAPAGVPSQGGSERVLLVDDEEPLADLMGRMIAKLGYRGAVYSNSREALAAFQAEPQAYDLLITDQTMPYLTGLELVEKVRRIRPDLPVILCTGYSQKVSPESARDLGIDRLEYKPLSYSGLAKAIRQVLDA